MAAFLLFILAVGGGVVLADLLRENTGAGEVTVFHQTVAGYPEGWLLAAAAGLGFAVAVLLVASWTATGRRVRRRRDRRRRPGTENHTVRREHDQDRLLDEFFGPDVPARQVAGPARPAHLRADRQEGRARHEQSWDSPKRVGHHPEPRHGQVRQAARLHDGPQFPARDRRR